MFVRPTNRYYSLKLSVRVNASRVSLCVGVPMYLCVCLLFVRLTINLIDIILLSIVSPEATISACECVSRLSVCVSVSVDLCVCLMLFRPANQTNRHYSLKLSIVLLEITISTCECMSCLFACVCVCLPNQLIYSKGDYLLHRLLFYQKWPARIMPKTICILTCLSL